MKLFEYMASRVPIVASKIPSINEIVTEKNVFFAEADNPVSFAKIIQEVLVNESEARQRSEQAYLFVLMHTWSKRAQRIISFIESTK
jgi:glycosyltransferase involved in cell wall biosynthesis